MRRDSWRPVLRSRRAGHRTQLTEQLQRLRVRRSRRLIEPAERRGIGDPGGSELQRDRREIRLEDLGRRMRHEVMLLVLRPEPIADARRDATSATAPLIRGRLGYTHRLQPRHARARREPWDA